MPTYQIATLAEGVGGLRDVALIVGVDPQPSDFLEYTEDSGVTLAGEPIESGAPNTVWKWGLLDQREFNAIYAYCTGMSARVYIRTRANSGDAYSYGVFRATMMRPKARTAPGLLRTDVEIKFISLESP